LGFFRIDFNLISEVESSLTTSASEFVGKAEAASSANSAAHKNN